MVVKVRSYRWFFLFSMMVMLSDCFAQTSTFARVRLSKRLVYAQEPVRATVTVYTSTWFTQPLDFANIQIPNAFIIPFSRTVPGVYHINGKQFAGLEFYYLIYPYQPGSYEIPAITVVAETPPEGGYQGKKITVKTQPVKYTVREIPKTYGDDQWFVARNVTITEHWNRSLANIRVGDFAERTITIRASGTLPNFIPPIQAPVVKGVSVYPNDPQLIDRRNDEQANGTRIEMQTFLFEKEGELVVPAETITWWDPLHQKIQTRQTKSIKVNVAPNPDPGMLATVRDSLNVTSSTNTTPVKANGPKLIMGLSWKKFVAIILAGICILYFMVRVFIRVKRKIASRWNAYTETEMYWFGKFTGNKGNAINSFYAWWDRLPSKKASLQESTLDRNIIQQWMTISASWNDESSSIADFKKNISGLRKKIMDEKAQKQDEDPHQSVWNG